LAWNGDQAQVGFHHALLGGEVAALHALASAVSSRRSGADALEPREEERERLGFGSSREARLERAEGTRPTIAP
jgi:hypothetical protein